MGARGDRRGPDLSFVPCVRSDVVAIELDGELVVSDPRTNQLHHLDAVAAVVWWHFDGTHALHEVVEDLAVTYGGDIQTITQDVTEFTRQLSRLDLLQDRLQGDSRREQSD